MTDNIITPVGRFVSGSLTEKRTTDHQGRTKREEDQRYEFGVAFRKDEAKMPEIFAYMHAIAMQKHAHLPAVQGFKLDGYSWKVKDGDAPDREGKVNENTRGHYVFYYSTSYAPNTCDQTNAEIPGEQIKRGYYVDLVMNCANNGLTDKPGIYMNPVWVRLVAFGEEIRGGVDAQTAFGGAQPAQLPPGASPTPLPGSAPSGAMMNQPAGNPAPAPAAAPTAPSPAASPLPGPTASPGNAQATPAPHHGFVDNATASQPNATGAPQPAATPPATGPGIPS